MSFVFAAMLVSFVVTLLIVRIGLSNPRTQWRLLRSRRAAWVRHPEWSGFGRAGGVGIAAGLAASLALRLFDDAAVAPAAAMFGFMLLASAMPVFLVGLAEDFTHRINAILRLLAAALSACVAGSLMQAWVVRMDMAWLDVWIAVPAVSVVFTCFAVAGLTNAFNIIDGFNGLAGGVAFLVLLGIAYVAFKVGDVAVMAAALTAAGAIAGFMLLNFPQGLIYLGDGGAYLVGFWIAELLVLLVMRNGSVSAWLPLLLCSYPIFETLFSIYRRVVLKRIHPGVPDVAHLHHLIYKRLVRWLVGTNLSSHRTQRNALTSPYLWLITSVGVVPAIIFWQNRIMLILGCFCFAVAYIYGYGRIVRFRAPGWWVLRHPGSRNKGDPGRR